MFPMKLFLPLYLAVLVSGSDSEIAVKKEEFENFTSSSEETTISENKEKNLTTSTTIRNTEIVEGIQETVESTTARKMKTRDLIFVELKNHTTPADIKDHPYLVSIQREMIHSCCGTIISSSWILTAAHCLTIPGSTYNLADYTNIAVVAGQSQLGLGKMQLKRVRNLYLHSSFVKKMLLNDVGLLRLYEPFELNDYVNVVLLSSSISKPYKYFSYCTVVSWTVYRKDFLSFDKLRAEDKKTKKLFKVPELQAINLPTISVEECSDRIGLKEFINRGHICTEYGTFKNVSCATDAGSPLICGGRQYGIFSWGIGCDEYDYPGVFSKVASFRKWIENIQADPDDYIPRNNVRSGVELEYSTIIITGIYNFLLNEIMGFI